MTWSRDWATNRTLTGNRMWRSGQGGMGMDAWQWIRRQFARRISLRRPPAESSTAPGRWSWPVFRDDVYLVSYPRSGNTWVRQMIALVRHPGLDLTKEPVNDYVPDAYEDPSALNRAPRPRFIKSHEPYTPVYPKVIYLYRDGRDSLVSWYHMETSLHDYRGTIEQFVQSCLAGSYGAFGSWQDHVRSWILVPRRTPTLKVRYEDLCEDPRRGLQAIAAFLRLRCSPARIEAAVRGSSRQVRQAFLRDRRPDLWNKGFRGGVTGGPGKWREVFSDDLLELYWRYAGEVMGSLGYCKRQAG